MERRNWQPIAYSSSYKPSSCELHTHIKSAYPKEKCPRLPETRVVKFIIRIYIILLLRCAPSQRVRSLTKEISALPFCVCLAVNGCIGKHICIMRANLDIGLVPITPGGGPRTGKLTKDRSIRRLIDGAVHVTVGMLRNFASQREWLRKSQSKEWRKIKFTDSMKKYINRNLFGMHLS